MEAKRRTAQPSTDYAHLIHGIEQERTYTHTHTRVHILTLKYEHPFDATSMLTIVWVWILFVITLPLLSLPYLFRVFVFVHKKVSRLSERGKKVSDDSAFVMVCVFLMCKNFNSMKHSHAHTKPFFSHSHFILLWVRLETSHSATWHINKWRLRSVNHFFWPFVTDAFFLHNFKGISTSFGWSNKTACHFWTL